MQNSILHVYDEVVSANAPDNRPVLTALQALRRAGILVEDCPDKQAWWYHFVSTPQVLIRYQW